MPEIPRSSALFAGTNSVFACQQDAQDYATALAIATQQVDCANLDGSPPNLIACDGVGLPTVCP